MGEEIISIHLGQAGVQIGSTFWSMLTREHGISPTGHLISPYPLPNNSFFCLKNNEKYSPRSLFFDTDPTTVDVLRKGEYKDLYHPDYLISGKESAADNHGRGRYIGSTLYLDDCRDKIRRIAEECNSLEGYMIYNSVGGGTGSGMGNYIMEELKNEYSKTSKIGVIVYPSPNISNSIIESYNTAMATEMLNKQDLSILFDNEALYHVCTHHHIGIGQPNYLDINHLIAQNISDLTHSIRYRGGVNTSLREMAMNLAPYEKAHFIYSHSLHQTLKENNSLQKEKSANMMADTKRMDMTEKLFKKESMYLSCDPALGKYISSSLMYRGHFSPKEIQEQLINLKLDKSLKFVDWSPTVFKIGFKESKDEHNTYNKTIPPNYECLQGKNTSVNILTNSTSIAQVFQKVQTKMYSLYTKRSWAWWYIEFGCPEYDLTNSFYDVDHVCDLYKELEVDSVLKQEREEER